jgi:hypothetical protein
LDKDKVWELRHTKDNRKLYNNRPPPPACDCEPAVVVVLVVLYVKEVLYINNVESKPE